MPASEAVARVSARRERCTIDVRGVVQGIGFRPLVYRLAVRHALAGAVRNSRQGVTVEVEGEPAALRAFLEDLAAAVPARGDRALRVTRGEPLGLAAFAIAPSSDAGRALLSPAPDLAACPECLAEMDDPGARRHAYALTTCAACGPRFTITRALPFDRARTAMAAFALCPRCRAEYGDPADRRFHAETIACPDCGPRVSLHAADGRRLDAADPIDAAARRLAAGEIVAIKGVGGYHLACDATSSAAVDALRRRKGREAKPLAVMVADLDTARCLGAVGPAEAALLASPARPIVLLAGRADGPLAPGVVAGLDTVGVMLSYTPLHHRLLGAVGRPLVVTSGNASDDAIAHAEDDAFARLAGAADAFLVHDRAIAIPCEDSVARVVGGVPRLIRRSRGYVPLALRLPVAAPVPVLACGGDLKSAFALVRGDEAFPSQHLGDLGAERAYRGYVAAVAHLEGLLELSPRAVVHDLHPAYRSTAYACSREGVERIAVQHHHAHVASCLADNGVDERVIGVAWDGTGHGPDGHVWGGEFLAADLAGFERLGHLELVALPGGEAAVREPWRMAAAFLSAAYGERMAGLPIDFVRRLDLAAWRVLARAAAHGLNAPLTSSAGRLFDAVASLLGLRDRLAYEGQAAMELEALAETEADATYPAAIDEGRDGVVVRTTDVVRGVVDDLLREAPPARIAARFHATLAALATGVCERIRRRTGLAAVALSGGVFQNARLLAATEAALMRAAFRVLTHRQVPPNDGGLAVGQAAVAARRLANRERG